MGYQLRIPNSNSAKFQELETIRKKAFSYSDQTRSRAALGRFTAYDCLMSDLQSEVYSGGGGFDMGAGC